MGNLSESAMQRPVMNPDFFKEPDEPKAPGRLRRLSAAAWRLGRWVVLLALWRPFMGRRQEPRGSWPYRLVYGLAYRLGVGVILLGLAVVALLTAATHPRTAIANTDPGSEGLYYDPVSFLSMDGVRLDAWLVPALDAQRVLQQKDQVLHDKSPAVILVHDYGQTREQMLPMIRPLHEAGFVVLAVSLRGCGSSGSSPQTFGLREWMDVKASLELLQRRVFVDDQRISAVGIGSGANAVLLAAEHGTALRALVIQNPIQSFDGAMDRSLLPSAFQRPLVQGLFRWTFGAMYRIDPATLRGSDDSSLPQGRRVLRLSEGLPYHPEAIGRVCKFLAAG